MAGRFKPVSNESESTTSLSLTRCNDKKLRNTGINYPLLTELSIKGENINGRGLHWLVPFGRGDEDEDPSDFCSKYDCDTWRHGCPDLSELEIETEFNCDPDDEPPRYHRYGKPYSETDSDWEPDTRVRDIKDKNL